MLGPRNQSSTQSWLALLSSWVCLACRPEVELQEGHWKVIGR